MTGQERQALAKQTILIIDDEEVVRMLFQSLLEDEGYTAFVAEDAEQGVQMLAQHSPAVALVDKNLPDVSGLDLIATQKKLHPDTEFIMITGYASLDSAVKAMEVGAFSYLTKPFDDMEVVLDRIRAALEVNNLRVETSQLRDKLSTLSRRVKPAEQQPPAALVSSPLATQVQNTITFLESFLSKRNQPPTAATWARMVDMIEQEAHNLKQILAQFSQGK